MCASAFVFLSIGCSVHGTMHVGEGEGEGEGEGGSSGRNMFSCYGRCSLSRGAGPVGMEKDLFVRDSVYMMLCPSL